MDSSLLLDSYKCLRYLRNEYFRQSRDNNITDWEWLQATDHALDRMEKELGLGRYAEDTAVTHTRHSKAGGSDGNTKSPE